MKYNDIILEASNVSKIYKKKKNFVRALDNISFTLKNGESLGIVGESGSGKSTLAKIIAQIEKPTEGKILFEKNNIFNLTKRQRYSVRRNIQMVFQNPSSAISPKMLIGDFLIEGMVNYKLKSQKEAKNQALILLDLVELPRDYINKFSNQLSGGELQRIVIARAISVNPKIIIFDEATSALDVLVRKNILQLLVKIKKEFNISYIFIGHDLAVVRLITNNIIVMNNGKIIERIDSENFTENANNKYTKTLIKAILTTHDCK